MTEEDIIIWANGKVSGAGRGGKMDSFKDKSLSDCQFIFDLLIACQSESVDARLINTGGSQEEKLQNANYAVSCARKMGATVFLLPEDIVEVQPKLLLTFFGAIMQVFGQR